MARRRHRRSRVRGLGFLPAMSCNQKSMVYGVAGAVIAGLLAYRIGKSKGVKEGSLANQ